MSTIRRQSVISSGIIYFGFALGMVNLLLLTKWFTPAQYGLTNIFVAVANIMFAFANLGMQVYIFKFYPYYNDNLEPGENDMMTWALLVSLVGFLLVVVGGTVFKDFVVSQFEDRSPEFVHYYYLIFPFGFGLTLYTLLESLAFHLRWAVLTNYLREVQFRIFSLLLIGLTYIGVLKNFDLFIKLYAFTYLALALLLLGCMIVKGKIHFTLKPSRVTKKFRRKILLQASLTWSGGVLYNVSFFFAQIVIAIFVPGGLTYVGVYGLAQNIASIIQAPQRGIIAASVGPLSRAWKDKDYGRISRIYARSSINQLIFSVAVFVLIWINFTDGVLTFKMKHDYLEAHYVFLFIGLTRVIDMGTGVNSQVIGTSSFWRFDFYTGIVLIAITLPLNVILTKSMGVTGPAIADLGTFAIYNMIRWFFLYRKFGMQPFTIKTVYAILLGVAGYFVCHFLFENQQGFLWLAVRSVVFLAIYIPGVLLLRLSEDIMPVAATLARRLGLGGKREKS
jgi:O-antigen/teichoic acid export membrane protein